MKERTLIILKPDCMEKRLMPEVLGRFFAAGLDIAACKMARLDESVLEVHYAHIAGKPYYPPLVEFMKRRPVIIAVLEGDNAIKKVRELLGPTNSQEAPKGTIRGDFGENPAKTSPTRRIPPRARRRKSRGSSQNRRYSDPPRAPI